MNISTAELIETDNNDYGPGIAIGRKYYADMADGWNHFELEAIDRMIEKLEAYKLPEEWD